MTSGYSAIIQWNGKKDLPGNSATYHNRRTMKDDSWACKKKKKKQMASRCFAKEKCDKFWGDLILLWAIFNFQIERTESINIKREYKIISKKNKKLLYEK